MWNTNNGIRKYLITLERGDVIGYDVSPYLLVKQNNKPIIVTGPSVYLLVDRNTQRPVCYREIWDGDLIGRDFRKLGTISGRDIV